MQVFFHFTQYKLRGLSEIGLRLWKVCENTS